jgi:hypothetical protein
MVMRTVYILGCAMEGFLCIVTYLANRVDFDYLMLIRLVELMAECCIVWKSFVKVS